MIELLTAGLGDTPVPYLEALELQRKIHAEVAAGTRTDTLILLEHPSVYTAGKRTAIEELPTDDTPVIPVDRGGKITWHGPGQLVGYPIFRLDEPLDVVAHVRRLETALINLLTDFSISGVRVDGRSGVWVGSPGIENKIAAIGVRVENRVTRHGFALNCNNSLAPYEKIIACGIKDAGITTISREIDRNVTTEEVSQLLGEHFDIVHFHNIINAPSTTDQAEIVDELAVIR